jgi:drug/metabolite transporter (DMT)-like permease
MAGNSEPGALPAAAPPQGADRTGLLLLASITLFWGVNWPAMKLAVAEIPVWSFRTICLLVGGLGLLAICRLGRQSLSVPRAELRPLILAALFNITGWHLFSAFGLVHMPAGRASIVAFTMPLWAALLAVPILGERLAPIAVAGLAVGMAGMAVLVVPDWHAIVAAPLGLAFMLLAALSWAMGTVLLMRTRWSMSTAALAGWQLLIGGLPVALGAVLVEGGFDPLAVSATGWSAALYAALIPMIYCHWAWFRVVGIYPAAVAAIGTLAIPVVGVLSSNLALGEAVGIDVVLSLCLVLAGLVLVLILPTWLPQRYR